MPIVTVNVSQQVAPVPSSLQQKGAIVTQGGTNTAAGTLTFLTQSSDLTAIQGAASTALTELQAAVNTFFAQGSSVGVYVLELGPGVASAGIAALTTWIAAHPKQVYAFLTPREWPLNDITDYAALASAYTAPTAKTYFFTTLDSAGDDRAQLAGLKSVFAEVEAPGIPTTEFSLAAAFRNCLAYNPSSTNLVTPTAYSFLYGVTPYPYAANQALLTTLNGANVNYVGTGAEGGISNAVLFAGTTMDGEDFTYWYSIDWMQINQDLQLSNAIINGSNNPLAPLYYNQAGINALQRVAVSVARRAISYGLALGSLVQTTLPIAQFTTNFENGDYAGQVVVNAEPFTAYNQENPNDYAQGVYRGLTLAYTPARGFKSIVFNVDVSNFVAA